MRTKFGIKNFRIFDEDGVILDISPITILTGTNSSGKSSVAKACLLLESFLKQIDFDIEKCKLDFMSYPLNTLGRYDKTVHKGSKNTRITFSYSMYSNYLFKDVTVTLVFNRDENDELNNGLLETLTISSEDKTIYSWDRSGGYDKNYCNYNLLRNSFVKFIKYEHELHKLADLNKQKLQDEIEGCEGEYYEEEKNIKNFLASCDNNILNCVIECMCLANKTSPYFGEKLSDEEIELLCMHNTFFPFSVYQEIENMNADQIEKFLLELAEKTRCNETNKTRLFTAVKKLLNCFRQSGNDSFIDFIMSLENDFMNSEKCRDYHLVFWPLKLTLATMMHNTMMPVKKYFSLNGNRNHNVYTANNYKEPEIADFAFAYEIISVLDFIYQQEPNGYTWEFDSDFGLIPVHKMYEAFKKYFNYFIKDCLKTDWNLTYVGSSRVEVRKMYSLENKDSFSKLLTDYFEGTKTVKNKMKVVYKGIPEKKYIPNSFTNKWLEKFGIGKRLILNVDENGLGVQIFIQKNDEEKPNLLCYEGYGITQLVSVILQIEVSILKAGSKYFDAFYTDRLKKFAFEEQTIIIEEPEIHLHPKYQSLLADMFYEAYTEYGINFIIETHSEYLIRKTQVLVARMKFTSNDECDDNNPFQTIYIASDKEPYSLGYRMDGKFKNDFGPGFFDEAVNLMMEIF